MINTNGNSAYNWPYDTNVGGGSYITVSAEYYYEVLEKARKWDEFMKTLGVTVTDDE